MMKRLALILLCLPICAATWYVDDSATGSQNGTSWANAWTNFVADDRPYTAPGDTVEIAAGTYGELKVRDNGTAIAPIVYRLAQQEDKRGPVYIRNIAAWSSYVHYNGAYDWDYPVPDDPQQIDTITNNIAFFVSHTNTTTHGLNVSGERAGINIKWIAFRDIGVLTGGFPADSEPAEHVIYIGDPVTDFEVGYCWFYRNWYGDTFDSVDDLDWGSTEFHHCLISDWGDDMFQLNGGFDFHHNKVFYRTWGYASGHSDVFQTWGGKVRIYNNIIYDAACDYSLDLGEYSSQSDYNSIGLLQTSVGNELVGPLQDLVGNFIFVNNVVYDQNTNRWGSPGALFTHNNKLCQTCDAVHWTSVTISNIVFANNLFNKPAARIYGHTFYWEGGDERGTNDLYIMTNCVFANNIVIDSYEVQPGLQPQSAVSGATLTFQVQQITDEPDGSTTGPLNSSTAAFKVKNNIVSGANPRVYLHRTEYANILAAQAVAGGEFANNSTNRPAFVFYEKGTHTPRFDFHLLPTDTNAVDMGYDLSAWTNDIPALAADITGVARGTGSGWDIGPYEYTDTGLILWLTFNDSTWTNAAATQITDYSGRGNHAFQYGYGNGTNWPLAAVGYDTTRAAEFTRWTNTLLSVGQEGRYAAVTNMADFGTNNTATFAVWALFGASYSGEWEHENNQSFVDAGYGYAGGMKWGKNGTKAVTLYYWTNSIATDGSSEEILRWPDPTGGDGASTNDTWHHFAFTYNSTNAIAYYDGAAYSTSSIPFLDATNLHMRGWLSVGCKTHYTVPNPQETPEFGDDEYPNHGWLNAKIDDLRIYNRALTATEIEQVYLGGAAVGTGEDEEPPEPPAPSTNRVMRATTARVGTIRGP